MKPAVNNGHMEIISKNENARALWIEKGADIGIGIKKLCSKLENVTLKIEKLKTRKSKLEIWNKFKNFANLFLNFDFI